MSKRTLIITLLLLCFPPMPRAHSEVSAWSHEILDNPFGIRFRLQKQLEQLDPKSDSDLWMSQLRKYLAAIPDEVLSEKERLELQALLMTAKQLARSLKREEAYTDFERVELRLMTESGQITKADALKTYEELITRASTHSWTLLKVRLRADLGLYYINAGDPPLGLQVFEQALEDLKDAHGDSEHLRLNIILNSSVILLDTDHGRKGMTQYQNLLAYCTKNTWRYFCSSIHFNIASSLIELANEDELHLAESHLKESERLINQLDAPADKSYIQYAWLKYFTRMRRYPEALAAGQTALRMFQAQNTKDFIAFTHMRLASTLLHQGKSIEAFEEVKESIEILEQSDYQGTLKEAYELAYQISKGLQQNDKALYYLELYTKQSAQANAMRDSVDFNKKATQLGLRSEEAKNLMLTQELENRKLLQKIIIALLILSVLALALSFNALRQFRQIQHLKLVEKRASDSERQEEILRLETKHRLSLAASVAHRINNPLNYLNLQIDQLKQCSADFNHILKALFSQDEALDPDTMIVKNQLNGISKSFDSLGLEMGLALTKAAQSIAEVRAMSGVDGCRIESISIHQVLQLMLERLQDILDPTLYRRLTIDASNLPFDTTIEGDFYILKQALEQLMLSLLFKSQAPIKASVLLSQQALSINFEGAPPENSSFYEALDASLNNLLNSASLRIEFQGFGSQLTFHIRQKSSNSTVEKSGISTLTNDPSCAA